MKLEEVPTGYDMKPTVRESRNKMAPLTCSG